MQQHPTVKCSSKSAEMIEIGIGLRQFCGIEWNKIDNCGLCVHTSKCSHNRATDESSLKLKIGEFQNELKQTFRQHYHDEFADTVKFE